MRQFQIPIFLEHTDAIWQVRFDDVIANALALGLSKGVPVNEKCPAPQKNRAGRKYNLESVRKLRKNGVEKIFRSRVNITTNLGGDEHEKIL